MELRGQLPLALQMASIRIFEISLKMETTCPKFQSTFFRYFFDFCAALDFQANLSVTTVLL